MGKLERIFPHNSCGNRSIVIKQRWKGDGQIALMSDELMDLQSDGGSQHFPLNVFDVAPQDETDLFDGCNSEETLRLESGITERSLTHFQSAYGNTTINKEDVFYYVYGLLYSTDYKTRFADNLSKQLPRIPAVNNEEDFWAFAEAGRKLGDLHVNYESVEPYPVNIAEGDFRLAQFDDAKQFFRVEQMRFAGKRPNLDKTKVRYNANITITDIPLEAYHYVVNGKSALEWVMERQSVKTDINSGITNDANDYANETMNNPAYPLELFQRIITVSMETMKIIKSLPALDID